MARGLPGERSISPFDPGLYSWQRAVWLSNMLAMRDIGLPRNVAMTGDLKQGYLHMGSDAYDPFNGKLIYNLEKQAVLFWVDAKKAIKMAEKAAVPTSEKGDVWRLAETGKWIELSKQVKHTPRGRMREKK